MNRFRARTIFIMIVMIAALSVARFAVAASFAMSPAAGTYEVGKTFTITVSAASSDKSVNAFSGTIKYPKDVLEYVGVSTGKSVVDQWLPPGSKGPSIRTSDGVINFEGVSISGVTGSSAELFRVTFKVKKTGTAELAFSSGSILANDGLGTDVLTAYGKGVYTLEPATIIPPKPVQPEVVPTGEVVEVPVAPAVTTPTQETLALRELVDQMKLLMTFAKFVLGAIMVLAIVLIILAIYLIHLAVWTKRRSRSRME